MCEAIRQLKEEAEQNGEKRGLEIGEKRGRQQGLLDGEKRGLEQGELNAKKSAAKNLYNAGMDAEKIANILERPVNTVKEWLK